MKKVKTIFNNITINNEIKLLIVAIIFASTSISCSNSIKDEEIVAQVKTFLEKDKREGFSTVMFTDWFEVVNIAVKDRQIKEKECTAICVLTLKVKKKYAGDSGITTAYGFLVGNEQRAAGSEVIKEMKFLFEKFEKGWLIKKEVR